jgi:adenylate kinase
LAFLTKNFLIIVGGVPGTGKTVISKLISRELKCAHLESSEVAIKLGIVKKDPSGRHTYLITDFKPLASYIAKVLKEKCIILATVYPFEIYEPLNEFIPLVIILRTDPRVLARRLEGRGWPRPKILENLLAEALGSIYDGSSDEFLHSLIEIDTTHKDPQQSLNEIYLKIEMEEFGRSIDWLEKIEIVELVSKWLKELESYEYGLS